MKQIVLPIVFLLGYCSFAGDRPDTGPEPASPDAMLSELVFGVIDKSGNVLTEKNFGEQTLQKVEPNHHNPGAPDLEFHRYEEGGDRFSVIWIHEKRSTVKFLLTTVRLRTDNYISGDLKPGITQQELIRMLGEPLDRRGNLLTYELETSFLPVMVEFILNDDSAVEEIMIEYPYD